VLGVAVRSGVGVAGMVGEIGGARTL
jgi:hypothetical protein